MKKYISLLLATAATIACTKVALEDNSPIESIPQDGNTENVQGEPSGEKIIISLAETKVSLDENRYYQFDGDEVIYVKARTTEAVAKLQNSADEKNTFTGVFNGLLGKDSETFDFYYNCYDENVNEVVKVQNGQPWLAATVSDVQRSTTSNYSYELSDVMLKQLDGYVCLALNSDYPCTVDFHTLTTALPNGETTISGIQLGSGSKKPYFVNIVSGMTGGFYLTVTNPEGQKMYTSYGTTAKISSNQLIKTKTFEAFSITGQLVDDTKTTFKSTYDVYRNSGAGAANGIDSDIISSGEATFTMTGISKTIRNLVSLKNITVKFSDDVSASVGATTPAWTETKSCTITIPQTIGHNKWGPVTVPNAVAVFSTPDGNDYQVSFANPSMTRHITGLPYKAIPPTKANGWSETRGSTNIAWETDGVKLKAAHKDNADFLKPLIQSPSFHLPDNSALNISWKLSYVLRSFIYWGKTYTTTMKFWIGGTNIFTNTTQSTSDEPHSDSEPKGTLTSEKKYVEFEVYSNGTGTSHNAYAIIQGIELYYR